MAEMPAAMFVVFVGMFFPLLILGTIVLRTTLLSAAVKDAVHAAAKAKTFLASTPEKPSAQLMAAEAAGQTASRFSGITIDNIQTAIVITGIGTRQITRSKTPLAAVDTSKNVYSLEVIVRGRVEPIIRMNAGFLSNVPGLTSPMPLTMTAEEMSENPQGLTE